MHTLILFLVIAAPPGPAAASELPRSPRETAEVPSLLIKIAEQVDVPAREAGVLEELKVREGQMVEEGSLIARIEDDEARYAADRAKIEAQVAALNAENDVGVRFAKKSVEVAKAELSRSTEAIRKYAKSISATEMDRLRLLVEKSNVEVEQAEHEFKISAFTRAIKATDYQAALRAVARRTIKSPISGVVVQVSRHRGEWVKPGETVVRILRLDRLRAEGFLKAGHLSRNLDGRDVKLVVDLPGQPAAEFPGKVVFVDPEIDPVNAQFRVWIQVLNPGFRLRPGMRARLSMDLP